VRLRAPTPEERRLLEAARWRASLSESSEKSRVEMRRRGRKRAAKWVLMHAKGRPASQICGPARPTELLRVERGAVAALFGSGASGTSRSGTRAGVWRQRKRLRVGSTGRPKERLGGETDREREREKWAPVGPPSGPLGGRSGPLWAALWTPLGWARDRWQGPN